MPYRFLHRFTPFFHLRRDLSRVPTSRARRLHTSTPLLSLLLEKFYNQGQAACWAYRCNIATLHMHMHMHMHIHMHMHMQHAHAHAHATCVSRGTSSSTCTCTCTCTYAHMHVRISRHLEQQVPAPEGAHQPQHYRTSWTASLLRRSRQ